MTANASTMNLNGTTGPSLAAAQAQNTGVARIVDNGIFWRFGQQHDLQVSDVRPGRSGLDQTAQSIEKWIRVIPGERAGNGLVRAWAQRGQRLRIDHSARRVGGPVQTIGADAGECRRCAPRHVIERRDGQLLIAAAAPGSVDDDRCLS
jgi:hypothetical protein